MTQVHPRVRPLAAEIGRIRLAGIVAGLVRITAEWRLG